MLCWAGQSGECWAWVPLAFSWQKHLLANTSSLPPAPTAMPWWMSASLPWTQTMSSELEGQETRYENPKPSVFTGRWHLWKKKKKQKTSRRNHLLTCMNIQERLPPPFPAQLLFLAFSLLWGWENLAQVYCYQWPCWSWLRSVFHSILFLGLKIKSCKTRMTKWEFSLISIIRLVLLFVLIQLLFQLSSSTFERIKI